MAFLEALTRVVGEMFAGIGGHMQTRLTVAAVGKYQIAIGTSNLTTSGGGLTADISSGTFGSTAIGDLLRLLSGANAGDEGIVDGVTDTNTVTVGAPGIGTQSNVSWEVERPAVTAISVESTLYFQASGRLYLGGVLHRYASKTATTFVGLEHHDGEAWLPGVSGDHDINAIVTDYSRARSALDMLRRSLLIETATGEALGALAGANGRPRRQGLEDDDLFRAYARAAMFAPLGTKLAIRNVLDALLPDAWEMFEDFTRGSDEDLAKFYVRRTINLDESLAGKGFLSGTVQVEADDTDTITLPVDVALEIDSVLLMPETSDRIVASGDGGVFLSGSAVYLGDAADPVLPGDTLTIENGPLAESRACVSGNDSGVLTLGEKAGKPFGSLGTIAAGEVWSVFDGDTEQSVKFPGWGADFDGITKFTIAFDAKVESSLDYAKAILGVLNLDPGYEYSFYVTSEWGFPAVYFKGPGFGDIYVIGDNVPLTNGARHSFVLSYDGTLTEYSAPSYKSARIRLWLDGVEAIQSTSGTVDVANSPSSLPNHSGATQFVLNNTANGSYPEGDCKFHDMAVWIGQAAVDADIPALTASREGSGLGAPDHRLQFFFNLLDTGTLEDSTSTVANGPITYESDSETPSFRYSIRREVTDCRYSLPSLDAAPEADGDTSPATWQASDATIGGAVEEDIAELVDHETLGPCTRVFNDVFSDPAYYYRSARIWEHSEGEIDVLTAIDDTLTVDTSNGLQWAIQVINGGVITVGFVKGVVSGWKIGFVTPDGDPVDTMHTLAVDPTEEFVRVKIAIRGGFATLWVDNLRVQDILIADMIASDEMSFRIGVLGEVQAAGFIREIGWRFESNWDHNLLTSVNATSASGNELDWVDNTNGVQLIADDILAPVLVSGGTVRNAGGGTCNGLWAISAGTGTYGCTLGGWLRPGASFRLGHPDLIFLPDDLGLEFPDALGHEIEILEGADAGVYTIEALLADDFTDLADGVPTMMADTTLTALAKRDRSCVVRVSNPPADGFAATDGEYAWAINPVLPNDTDLEVRWSKFFSVTSLVADGRPSSPSQALPEPWEGGEHWFSVIVEEVQSAFCSDEFSVGVAINDSWLYLWDAWGVFRDLIVEMVAAGVKVDLDSLYKDSSGYYHIAEDE